MDKEIKKLGEEIFLNCPAGLFKDEAEAIARFVIEKRGYRKKKELEAVKTNTAREIIEAIEQVTYFGGTTRSELETMLAVRIAELKKKYTEEQK